MINSRQLSYLDAMGIEVWKQRVPESGQASVVDIAPGLKLGPGTAATLLICASDSQSASKLANDIGRLLGNNPIWAWPLHHEDAVKLEEAVKRHLFTTIAIFGERLADRLFGSELPSSVLTSRVVLLPEMQHLEMYASARRALWTTLCTSGMLNTHMDAV